MLCWFKNSRNRFVCPVCFSNVTLCTRQVILGLLAGQPVQFIALFRQKVHNKEHTQTIHMTKLEQTVEKMTCAEQ